MYKSETYNDKARVVDIISFCGTKVPYTTPEEKKKFNDFFDRMEVWSSSFTDPGPDYNEFRFFKDDKLVKTITRDGY